MAGKVIELSVGGKPVYSRNEFVGKNALVGTTLFLLAFGLATWFYTFTNRYEN